MKSILLYAGGAILLVYGLWRVRRDLSLAVWGSMQEAGSIARMVRAVYRRWRWREPFSSELRADLGVEVGKCFASLVVLAMMPIIWAYVFVNGSKHLPLLAGPDWSGGLVFVFGLWVGLFWSLSKGSGSLTRMADAIRKEQAKDLVRK